MRRALAALALLLLAAAPRAEASGGRCDDHRGKTTFRTGQVRVYAVAGDLYACRRPGGRSLRLDSADGPDPVVFRRFRAAGRRWLTYERRQSDRLGDVRLTVVRADLRGRRVEALHTELQLAGSPAPRARVWAGRLKRNGSFAFLSGPSAGPDRTSRYSVVVADSAGTRILDEGPQIDRRSFRATATTVTWRTGAESRSVPFD